MVLPLTLTDDVMTATNAFAIGNMKLVADFSRKMTTDPATPVVQFAHTGDPPPPHALTGTWTTSQQWTSNLYPLNLGTATLGKNTMSVSGARSCVPDPSTNLMTTPAAQDFTAAITPTSRGSSSASARRTPSWRRRRSVSIPLPPPRSAAFSRGEREGGNGRGNGDGGGGL